MIGASPSSMTLTKAARIKTGTHLSICFEVPEELRAVYAAMIEKAAKVGDRYDVEIAPTKRRRSTGDGSQNHHLFGHRDQLAILQGVRPSLMGEYIKIRAAAELNYPTIKLGDEILPQSEAEASVDEESLLIDMAHIIGSELHVSLYEDDRWYNP